MSTKRIEKSKLYIIDAVIFIIGVAIDRLTKIFAVRNLKDRPSVSVVSGILELRYLENKGAAFGLLKGQKSFIILVGIIILLACLYVLIKTPGKRKYIMCHVLISFIVVGAVGNLIDRILYDYVVDFIYLSFIKFPIFNFADIFITVATFVLVILLLFYYKEDDLNFLRFMEKRLRDVD